MRLVQMGKPLVTMAMTVFNGEQYLEKALDSLLAQDYGHFELIILDNLSNDRTQEICLNYARRDSRIRYILDEKLRNGHDAATHIAAYAKGTYYLSVSDDDIWDSSYVSKLVSILESDQEIGLAFSNGYFIDAQGRRVTDRCMVRGSRLYQSSDSRLFNFCHYLVSRHVVPLALGVYRTSVFRRALPFKTFDATVADVDNLFVLRLLTLTQVHSIDEPLLYYRVYPNKNRWEDPQYGRYPADRTAQYMWSYWWKHRLRFNREILRVIDMSDFSLPQKNCLKLFVNFVTFTRPSALSVYVLSKRLTINT
jgi:glycosyltransferase involved in cell wall biosynthesis